MNGTFSAAIVAAATLSTLGGYGFVTAVKNLAPAAVVFDALAYDPAAGLVTYHPRARGRSADDPLAAWWSASLTMDDAAHGTVPICRGSGEGFYWDRPDPLRWPISTFVGPTCPSHLSPGEYRLTATVGPLDGDRPSVISTKFEVKE